MASSRRKANRISSILDGQGRLEKKGEIIDHIEGYFASLYVDEGLERPTLGNMAFDGLGSWGQMVGEEV